jgi:hypothetical protein
MNKIRGILIAFIMVGFFSPLSAYEHYFAVCAIFKNEARYLREWIEYYRLQGAEKFFLYNNESQDHYLEVLQPYINRGIVELKDWPNSKNNTSKYYTKPVNHWDAQIRAYNDCLENNKGSIEWAAFIDIDEFIVPKRDNNIVSYLMRISKNTYIGAIKINWQLFGTSGFSKLTQDSLITETLVKKAPHDFSKYGWVTNAHIKSLVKLSAATSIHCHFADLKHPFKHHPKSKFVSDDFGSNPRIRNSMKPIRVEEIQINHYWIRDLEYFLMHKLERKAKAFPKIKEIFPKLLTELNEEIDTSIQRFVPELKHRCASQEIVD